MIKSLSELKGRNVLVLGIGGGGDVISATIIACQLRRYDVNTLIGGIPWERYVIDPKPGPIPLDCFKKAKLYDGYCIVNGESYVVREGRKFKPQVANVAKIISEELIVIDLYGGVYGVRRILEDLSGKFGFDFIIGVDVGGDILAYGHEEDLWSPLADQLMLASIASSNIESLIAIHAIAADGELSIDELFNLIAEIASKKGLISVRGLEVKDIELLEKLVKSTRTEASLIPLLAFKGHIGSKEVRSGTRKVNISPVMITTYYVDSKVLFESRPLARSLVNTKSFKEVVEIMHAHGVYTEYDLETDLERFKPKTANEILEIRRRGRKALKSRMYPA